MLRRSGPPPSSSDPDLPDALRHLLHRHLRRVLAEFADYYNHDRRHRSLGLQAPLPSTAASQGGIVVRLVLGGLHHVYERAG